MPQNGLLPCTIAHARASSDAAAVCVLCATEAAGERAAQWCLV